MNLRLPSKDMSAVTAAAAKTRPIMNTLEINGDWNITNGKLLRGAITALGLATSAAFGAADLLPQRVSASPTTVIAGNALTVSYTVRNQGDTTAPASHTKVQIKNSASAEVVAQDYTTQAINANSSVTESRVVNIPASAAAGVYKAFVILDNNREVAQDGAPRNNMSAGTAFTVQVAIASAADLMPQSISVSPATVTAGKTVTVNYTVRNQGDTTAPASRTKVQIKNSASVEVVAQDFETQAISPNSSVSESREVTVPSNAATGVYKAFVIVDNNREVSRDGGPGNDMSGGTTFTVQAISPR